MPSLNDVITCQQSRPWVGLTHGLGRLGRDFFLFFGGLGWVHYNKSTKKFESIMLVHLKHDQ